ncbi:patatin-like phospholipase family protein [Vibrio algarum]|uniref:Patatin-like phospholipase family protein n=1 Tax=Vibrio algarum TaxID=3020714 RepID=A0ABT4YUV0_9VIBR|nr:patatin-like phospholipase family protein [Vibrio sp. KJ40-1]MDB1125326.1 patatin-like phospholipase family protein [Vibrio sp. KJ40-1]
MRFIILLITLLTLSACSSYGTINNEPLKYNTVVTDLYSLASTKERRDSGEFIIIIAMSGGGTRAAALSYGVLKGLKEELVTINGVETSLLDEVDFITSVSGGSFTAAYYGLHGDKIFTDYEDDFLYNDVGSDLFWRAMNPALWFSTSGLTDEAVAYYQDRLFGDATFSDIDKKNSPLIIINATDLGGGVRFSFTQEYFNLICSNISSYPIASAVAASAAVPIAFNPVVLKNHTGCGSQDLFDLDSNNTYNAVKSSVVEGLKSYSDKDERQYIHLVDGGITDNLGLQAMWDISNISKQRYLSEVRSDVKPHLISITVDASTTPHSDMEKSSKTPGILDTLNQMSDIQIHHNNDVTRNYYKQSLLRFGLANDISTYFIDVSLNNVKDPEDNAKMNNIPTDLELEAEQVDALIKEGMKQVQTNENLIKFLRKLEP